MHVRSFWCMNFCGMFFPYLLGNGTTEDFKWNCQVSEAFLSKQASWTGACMKKKGTHSFTAEHSSTGSWEICLKQNPLADCHYLAAYDDLGAPCTA